MSEQKSEEKVNGIDAVASKKSDVVNNSDTQDSSTTKSDEKFQGHPTFKKYLPNQLCEVIEKWLSNSTLDEDQKEIFQTSADFLLRSTKTDSDAQQWINEQSELIGLTEKCLNEIASDGKFLGINTSENPSLKSLNGLVQAFENARCKQLLDALVKCVTSKYYIDAIGHLKDPKASSLTNTQDFLLITCPRYITTCDQDKSSSSKISNEMLDQYVELFNQFLPNVKEWTSVAMSCLFYPMKLLLPHIRSSSYDRRKPLYDSILSIILNIPINASNADEPRIRIIYTALSSLIEIIRWDRKLSNHLKNKATEKDDLINILKDYSKNDVDEQIELKAVELISLLVPEEELLKENNSEKVTALFLKNFNAALRNGKPNKINSVLKGFKDLVQNDDVKQEVLKQNALLPIVKFAKERDDDPTALDVVYAMTFNKEANQIIREDTEFIDHVKQLTGSEIAAMSKAAHGILWKIEGEQKFEQKKQDKLKKKEEKNKKKEEKVDSKEDEKTEAKPDEEKKTDAEQKSEDDSEKEPQSYDMMISYCWAQQPLCHKINDRLEKDGYSVWLDRDEMRGSIIESMAEAIEHSTFVLICMSSNYKKSANCKAEAEYAYNQKSKIIPLIVEPNYKADGWLGFMAGSKIYVDFADKEDEEFDKAYDLLIEELKRNGLDETNRVKAGGGSGSDSTKSKPEEPKKEEPKKEKKEEPKKETKDEPKKETKDEPKKETKDEPKKETKEEPKKDKKSEDKEDSKKTEESKTAEEPPKEPEKPVIQTREYLNHPIATAWNDQNVMEFLADNHLNQLISVCESMDGEDLVEFHQSCETMADIRYALLNNPDSENSISFGTLFKFISKLRKYLPPKPGRKVYFQYQYAQPQSDSTCAAIETTKNKT